VSQKVAVCNCGSLLIWTQYFREREWLCLRCGQIYQSPPRAQDSTQEAEAKWRALESEFMTNCGSKLIVQGMYREGCERCDRDEPHLVHATKIEWKEVNDALYWLSTRTGREFRLVNGVMTPQ
jgi:DNA-directed RNA polymerase subunit M/transcription elongation factor TFIIS